MRRTALTTALVMGIVTTGGLPAARAEEPAACSATHQIAQVQGAGDATPVNGRTVRVEGVVTGDFQPSDRLRGFFVQDDTPDASAATSDGLFVYSTEDVGVGDRVVVTGKAVEYHGLTELSPVTSVEVCGTGTIEPARVRLPLPNGVTRERYEGVLVRFRQRLTATETYQLGRYGEVSLSAGGRLFQPTDGHGGTQEGNEARRLLLDDGSTVQNPDDVPFTSPRAVRVGDRTTNLTGVLSYGFNAYRLQPTRNAHFARTNPRPARPRNVGGDVTVASFNTLNWFTTLDRRGADTVRERERQLDKLVAALTALDADAVGLMEVENNGDTAVGALVARLNAAAGAGTYTWTRHPSPGTDEIHVALIYKPAKLTPVGAPRSSGSPIFDRPPLLQTFKSATGGSTPFTVVINHFKSKGCGGATGPDRDQGDGQGCYNARRVAQAQGIVDLAENVPNPLVIGDLNAYAAEDPIRTLTASGMVSLTQRFVRPADRYSYIYKGQSGELDHALAPRSLSRRVTGTTIWHINSDEPRILDYNTEYNPPGLYRPDAFRSSDHDPVLIGLRLRK